jgi:hypothetical protein
MKDFAQKYLKYKIKYLSLKNKLYGGTFNLDKSDCQLNLITQDDMDSLLLNKFNLFGSLKIS